MSQKSKNKKKESTSMKGASQKAKNNNSSRNNNIGGDGRRKIQTAPVAVGNRSFQTKPRYTSRGENLMVSHSEYLGDVTGSTSVYSVIKTVNLNPGLSSSFPWLNQIASRYESYKFRKCHFRFMTERPTTESGYVAIVPDFDPTDAAPVDKQTAFQYQAACKSAPWENLTMVCPKEDLVKRKTYYVRQGALNSNETLGLYDTGNIFVCAGGNSGAVSLGELWCDYDVELMTPQLDSNYGASDSGIINGVGTMSAAAVFGTAPTQSFARNTLWSLVPATGTLTFLQNYQGSASISVVGTGVGTVLTTGSTATVSVDGNIVNGSNTGLQSEVRVNALSGQTLVVTLNADTTITSSSLRMGAYQNSLG